MADAHEAGAGRGGMSIARNDGARAGSPRLRPGADAEMSGPCDSSAAQ